jgi:hypothetical protein
MTHQTPATYKHTQKGPWFLLLYAFGLPMVAVAVWLSLVPEIMDRLPFVPIVVGAGGFIMLVLAPSFHHLTVADEGDRLTVRFGPLPLFRTHIRYADIRAVEVGKTTLLDGLGIHWSIRGGWVWNIWGLDCVIVRHGGTTFVGTDDAENLAAFLRTKMPVAAGRE